MRTVVVTRPLILPKEYTKLKFISIIIVKVGLEKSNHNREN